MSSFEIEKDWQKEGKPDGAVTQGVGFLIHWQRGALTGGRNGAFLIEVLKACLSRLEKYQSGEFACEENQSALEQVSGAILALESRRTRREESGTLGTHTPD